MQAKRSGWFKFNHTGSNFRHRHTYRAISDTERLDRHASQLTILSLLVLRAAPALSRHMLKIEEEPTTIGSGSSKARDVHESCTTFPALWRRYRRRHPELLLDRTNIRAQTGRAAQGEPDQRTREYVECALQRHGPG